MRIVFIKRRNGIVRSRLGLKIAVNGKFTFASEDRIADLNKLD